MRYETRENKRELELDAVCQDRRGALQYKRLEHARRSHSDGQ